MRVTAPLEGGRLALQSFAQRNSRAVLGVVIRRSFLRRFLALENEGPFF